MTAGLGNRKQYLTSEVAWHLSDESDECTAQV